MSSDNNYVKPLHPVVGELFALITCKLEDAHRPSVSGHRPKSAEEALQEAVQINTMAQEITILCEAIEALLNQNNN